MPGFGGVLLFCWVESRLSGHSSLLMNIQRFVKAAFAALKADKAFLSPLTILEKQLKKSGLNENEAIRLDQYLISPVA